MSKANPASRIAHTAPFWQRTSVKSVVLGAALFGLWWLLSGLSKPILLVFGVFSTALVVAIVARLGILDSEGVPITVKVRRMSLYMFWLIVEVAKADWAVTKVILSPDAVLRQRLLRVPATTRTDLGKVVFANSITLTPGTVTVETEGDTFIVHSLTDEAADLDALAEMNARVADVEIKDGLTPILRSDMERA